MDKEQVQEAPDPWAHVRAAYYAGLTCEIKSPGRDWEVLLPGVNFGFRDADSEYRIQPGEGNKLRPATFSIIVSDPCRLPSALTGVALRIQKFTVTKMSTSRWLLEIPEITENQLQDLSNALPSHVAEFHPLDWPA